MTAPTYVVQTSIEPGVSREVSRAEYERLLELGILLNGPADPQPADYFDQEVAALLGTPGTATRTAAAAIGGSPATETAPGTVELATPAETATGTDATRAVHPAGVKPLLDAKAAITYVDTAVTGAKARANHTGTQSADTLVDGTTNRAFLGTERTKLAGIATGATANSSDATLLARANHTGTQTAATISDLTETVQDIVGAFIVAGTGCTVTYDDVANTFTINVTGGGGTGTTDTEIVRDTIGAALVAGAGVQITVNDVGDTITIASTAVLPTRQVTAGTGLTGGGDLSADRSLAVAYGTAAGTAAQGNDSRITGAVPNTRSVTAGTGLTGGGTLAADRSLAVTYGATAGTAVQGNDTRVTADQAAATASIRTLGTGASQAAAGDHGHSDLAPLTGVEGIKVHDGTAGGGTRPTGYARVRWTGGAARPTNMVTGDIWEHDA